MLILHYKGSKVRISIKLCISVNEDYILKNSAGPYEMPPYAAFYLGICCLQKYQVGVSGRQRIN